MSGRGRPKEDRYSKYVAGNEDAVRAACRKGATSADLAELLGCGRTTITTLIKESYEFKALVKSGKGFADLMVENALYKRAMGYDYEEVYTEVRLNKDGSGTTTYAKKIKKHVVPDVLAQMAWLRNRQPDLWNIAQQKIDLNKSVSPGDMDLSGLSDSELKEFHKLTEKAFNASAKK